MSELIGEVVAVYVGDRPDVLKSARDSIEFNLEGIVGDRHAGFTKKAGVRDKKPIPKGAMVRNWRQWSAVSIEEMNIIAQNLGVEELDSGLIGANFALSGIERFSQLPRGSMLWFPQDAILVVEETNEPCTTAGEGIQTAYAEIKPEDFPKAAIGIRGLVGIVHRSGTVRAGDIVRVQVYQPKSYFIT